MPDKSFKVELPAGGFLELGSAEEVDLWTHNAKRYIEDYGIVKQNDLVLLGTLLTQSLTLFRAQAQLASAEKVPEAHNRVNKATEQIQATEKALGIDKKSRDQGGHFGVAEYLATAKKAAHEKGVRIAARTKAYEAFVNELSWRVRLLRNGDAEDRQHHGLSEESLINWCEAQIRDLAEQEMKWAHEKGKVFVGRL